MSELSKIEVSLRLDNKGLLRERRQEIAFISAMKEVFAITNVSEKEVLSKINNIKNALK